MRPSPPYSVDSLVSSDFVNWQQQDQLLASWLLSSIGEDILSHLIGHESSFDIWQKVEFLYASALQANIMHYKNLKS